MIHVIIVIIVCFVLQIPADTKNPRKAHITRRFPLPYLLSSVYEAWSGMFWTICGESDMTTLRTLHDNAKIIIELHSISSMTCLQLYPVWTLIVIFILSLEHVLTNFTLIQISKSESWQRSWLNHWIVIV